MGYIYGMKNVREALYKIKPHVVKGIQLTSLISLLDIEHLYKNRVIKEYYYGIEPSNSVNFEDLITTTRRIVNIHTYTIDIFKDKKVNIQNSFDRGILANVESFGLSFKYDGNGYDVYNWKNEIFENFLEITDDKSGNKFELCSVSYFDGCRDKKSGIPNLCILLKHDDGKWYRHDEEITEEVGLNYVIEKATFSGRCFAYSKKIIK